MQPSLMSVPGRIRFAKMGDASEGKQSVTLRLLVKDFKDRPFGGIEWEVLRGGLGEMSIPGRTDGNGTSVVTFETSEPRFTVCVHMPEGEVRKGVLVADAASEVLVMRSVQEAPQAILNTMEIVAGSTGLALIVAGLLSGITLVERAGETAVMATIFYRVGRAVL